MQRSVGVAYKSKGMFREALSILKSAPRQWKFHGDEYYAAPEVVHQLDILIQELEQPSTGGEAMSNKSDVALQIIPQVLQIQLALTGVNAGVLSKNRWALGYIFGFHDGVLQALQVSDQAEALAIMAVSYTKLLDSPEAGGVVHRQSLGLQTDQTFMEGRFAGGQDAVEYLRDRKPPLGLATYLLGQAK